MTKYLLILLVNSIFASEAPRSREKSREKAIVKLLAALQAILERPDLGRIKIEINRTGEGFTMETFYRTQPQELSQTVNQASTLVTTDIARPILTAAASVDTTQNSHVGQCKCSRCEYNRQNK
jgi:hypothetical protein